MFSVTFGHQGQIFYISINTMYLSDELTLTQIGVRSFISPASTFALSSSLHGHDLHVLKKTERFFLSLSSSSTVRVFFFSFSSCFSLAWHLSSPLVEMSVKSCLTLQKNWFLLLCLLLFFSPLTSEGKSRERPRTGLYDSQRSWAHKHHTSLPFKDMMSRFLDSEPNAVFCWISHESVSESVCLSIDSRGCEWAISEDHSNLQTMRRSMGCLFVCLLIDWLGLTGWILSQTVRKNLKGQRFLKRTF